MWLPRPRLILRTGSSRISEPKIPNFACRVDRSKCLAIVFAAGDHCTKVCPNVATTRRFWSCQVPKLSKLCSWCQSLELCSAGKTNLGLIYVLITVGSISPGANLFCLMGKNSILLAWRPLLGLYGMLETEQLSSIKWSKRFLRSCSLLALFLSTGQIFRRRATWRYSGLEQSFFAPTRWTWWGFARWLRGLSKGSEACVTPWCRFFWVAVLLHLVPGTRLLVCLSIRPTYYVLWLVIGLDSFGAV